MHCTKISPSLNVKVKGQGHRGQKNESAAFCSGVILWGAVLVRHFFRKRSSGGTVLYAGGTMSACCLVLHSFCSVNNVPARPVHTADSSVYSRLCCGSTCWYVI